MLALQAVKDPGARRDRRIRIETCKPARGARSAEVGARKLQIFVRLQRRLHQFIERGLTEYRPEVRPDIALRVKPPISALANCEPTAVSGCL